MPPSGSTLIITAQIQDGELAMTVQDIVQFAIETTGDISSEAYDFGKRALRLKYATLYDSHNWRESMRTIDSQPLNPVLKGALFLPVDAEEVIFCSLSYDNLSYVRLTYRERDWIERFYVPAFNIPGNTPWFYRAENLAWPEFDPGKFTFTTTEKAPFKCYIAGRDANNYPISESFILQGINNPDGTVSASSITTQNTYHLVTVLSKDVISTALSVRALASSTQIVMPPAVTEMVFTQLVLYPTPIFTASDGSPLSIYVRTQVKLKPDALNDDMSVPRISHVWEALISFTTSAMWKRLQQVQKAAADNSDGMEHVKAAINVEKNQSEFRQQVVPIRYESGNYMDDYWHYGKASSGNPFGT